MSKEKKYIKENQVLDCSYLKVSIKYMLDSPNIINDHMIYVFACVFIAVRGIWIERGSLHRVDSVQESFTSHSDLFKKIKIEL